MFDRRRYITYYRTTGQHLLRVTPIKHHAQIEEKTCREKEPSQATQTCQWAAHLCERRSILESLLREDIFPNVGLVQRNHKVFGADLSDFVPRATHQFSVEGGGER